MQCGSLVIDSIDHRGRIEDALSSNLKSLITSLPRNQWNWGFGYRDGYGGIGIVGWGERSCSPVGPPFAFSEASNAQGRPASGLMLLSPSSERIQMGTQVADGAFVAGYEEHGDLVLREFLADGAANRSFGHAGALGVRVSDSSLSTYYTLIASGPGRGVTVIAPDRSAVKVLRVTG
jgi:hypothetical protein